MAVQERLSAAQRRVLEGAVADKLRAYRSFNGSVSFWLEADEWRLSTVRAASVEALERRGLLERVHVPFGRTVPIGPSEAGRGAVS